MSKRGGIGGNGGPPLMGDDTDEGWVKVQRRIRRHEIVGFGKFVTPADPKLGWAYSRNEAWQDLIMECNYKPGVAFLKGKRIEIKPGQVLGASAWLARRWNWTRKTVRNFIARLERHHMLEVQAALEAVFRGPDPGLGLDCVGSETGHYNGNQPNVLTVCNYETYQVGERPEGPPEGPPKGHQGATEGPHLKKERRKEIEKENPLTPLASFDPEASGDPVDASVVQAAFDAYNATAKRCGLSQATTLTDDRRKKIKDRLDTYGLDGWTRAMANIEKSAFLTGKNDKKWKASLEFVLQASSFNKLHDGVYGNGRAYTPPDVPKGPSLADQYAQMRREEAEERAKRR
jgi:hypothetical protein